MSYKVFLKRPGKKEKLYKDFQNLKTLHSFYSRVHSGEEKFPMNSVIKTVNPKGKALKEFSFPKPFDIDNCKYILNYDYNLSGCVCDPNEYICRCTEITDVRVEPDFKVMYEEIAKKYWYSINNIILKNKEILMRYAIDRVLMSHKHIIEDPDRYDPKISPGYYGEELDSIFFDGLSDIKNDLNNALERLLESPTKLIQHLLKKEYGYLLESLEKITNIVVVSADTISLVAPNLDYAKKLDRRKIDFYKERESSLPIGIYTHSDDDSNKFKLIDGYHRYFAAKESTNKKVKIILCSIK